MQNSQLPLKWYRPFAVDDAAKVEIPITSADPTRASQSLGFPPLTMQPPESGGMPPQGEDFNGAMNQVARLVWWMMAGGALPFDSAWAGNAAIDGYPNGGRVTSADLQGEWLSTADNNTINPDTVGTNWVPGYAYGRTAITGLTNANITLTPAQASKTIIALAGTLTGNIQVIFPTWLKDWIVINNCTGAFSVTCKTAAGAGVVVAQGGGAQIVWGDGGNLLALSGNTALPLLVGDGVTASQAVRRGQFQQPISALAKQFATNTTLGVTASFTAPGPGLLFAVGIRNVSGVAAGTNLTDLLINGVSLSSDNTTTTIALTAYTTTTGGPVSATCNAASSLTFSVSAQLIWIPAGLI